jgi:hypothetical protein
MKISERPSRTTNTEAFIETSHGNIEHLHYHLGQICTTKETDPEEVISSTLTYQQNKYIVIQAKEINLKMEP